MTYVWRRSTGKHGVWHLMRPDRLETFYCGRNPQGAWKVTGGPIYPWPEHSCFSCMDVECGNFPPQREAVPA